MKNLTTLAQMREALAEDGAMLVFDERILSRGYYIQRANGTCVRCTKVADRLTSGNRAAVKFSHRTAVDIFYAPKR